jgi:hypothetical protein
MAWEVSTSSPDHLIVEGLLLSLDAQGRPHLAPMGPRVDRQFRELVLRPFRSSQTFANLAGCPWAVFHITDDVALLARAAIGQLDALPALEPIAGFACPRLRDTCRWLACQVQSIDARGERAEVPCRIVAQGEVRPFFGLCRAKHAVVEAAILATRVGILPSHEIRAELGRLAPLVHKTGGHQERAAWQLLETFLAGV